MKNLKQKFEVIIRLTVAVITFITSFSYVIPVFAEPNTNNLIVPKSEIVKSKVVSTTEQLKEGEVKLEKSISKEDETTYTVNLTATGKDKKIEKIENIYIAVVFDTSSSMGDYDETGHSYITTKYTKARDAAITFSSNLLKEYPKAQLALVTYGDGSYANADGSCNSLACAEIARDFKTKAFTTSNFPDKLDTLTNMASGVKLGTDILLTKKQNDPNGKFYMIILGDGEPNLRVGEEQTQATIAKNAGIEIFSIGYALESSEQLEEGESNGEDTLKSLATDENHYFPGNESDILTAFSKITNNISYVNAGTDAVITDVIANNFTYVEGSAKINNKTVPSNKVSVDGQKISFKVGNITESGVTVSFQIKLNTNGLTPGEYPTNDSASIDYTDAEGKNPNGPEIIITESPKIKWNPEYKYTINYYKDEIKEENKLGKSITGSAVVGTKITVDENLRLEDGYNSITDELDFNISANANIINIIYTKRTDMSYTVKYLEKDTNASIGLTDEVRSGKTFERTYEETAKSAPTGYKLVGENTQEVYIDQDNKIVTFYYEKKNDLSYTVEYYKDNNKISDDAKNTVTNQTFGTQIQANQIELNKYKPLVGYNPGVFETDMPYTIQDGTNTIKVCYYKRTDMSYTVKYLEKDTNASIGLADEVRNGKTFEGTYEETAKSAPTGYRLVGENTQEVYIDQDNKIITFYYEKRDDFSYKVNYLEKNTNKVLYKQTIRNNKTYNKTYTEDAIEISGYNLVGENTQTFSLTEDGFEITFFYTKKTNLSYTINYYKDSISDSNKFKTETEENQVFNATITSDMIDVLENTPYGYTNGTITNKMPYTIIDGDNIINVVYNKRTNMNYIVKFIDNTTLEELDSKVKENKTYLEIYTETVEDSDIPFGYELVGENTQEVLMDENGKVVTFKFEKRKNFKYTVNYLEKDTNNVLAPSKEETNKTYLETYEETALTIPGYNLVAEEVQDVYIDSENKEITFFYTKKNDLTYRVEYYFDGEIDSSKTDIFKEIEFGTVIREYKDKLPEGYVFDSDTAPLTIEDSEDNVLKVYYKSLPQGDIAPPKTGIDNTNYLSLIYLIATIGLVFISRKQED